MPNSHEKDLARVSRESAEHIAANVISNHASREHVRSSKAAIARSLDLLRSTAPKERD